MSVKIKPAFLAIVFLASPLAISTNAASAAESCLTAPGKPGPQGSRWYYRLEFPSKRKCWHLVLKGGAKPQAVARVTAPQADDETEPAAAAPAPTSPAERSAEASKPAPEPVIRTLVTRNASNPGAIVPSPDQPSGTASADESANASAPAEQAAATEPAQAPVVEAPPRPAAIASAQTSEPGMSITTWLPAGIALLGLLACAVFFVVEMRRRRTDVLNAVGNDDPLPVEALPEEREEAPADRATFAPLPAMRPMPIEDDVDLALRRFARRRAA